MCVATPGRVTRAGGGKATVEIDGQEREVIAVALPDLQEGEFVLVSLGMVLGRIDEEEAAALASIWREVADAMDSEQERSVR